MIGGFFIKEKLVALSIAGFDPSGGAGILADIKTFQSLGLYGTGVITALTAQNVQRVGNILEVPIDLIEQEIDLILEDLPVNYCKTGMLYSEDIIKLVSKKVKEYNLNLVVDPILIASSGCNLYKSNLVSAMKNNLLKNSLLVTPNIYEAEVLSGLNITTKNDALVAAEKIGKICNVVITGGHLDGDNFLYNGEIIVMEGELIETDNTHGSGCSFSAAITSYLCLGNNLIDSIKNADHFIKKSIRYGAYGTLDQFWNINNKINKIDLK